MSSLLVVEVSPRYGASTSRKLADHFVAAWRAAHGDGHVARRDLARTPLPFVDAPWIGGAFTPPETHSPESRAAIEISDSVVRELQAADHLLIATPMYNFAVPAALKAWIDHVVRVGVTVSSDNVGLLTGKKATVIIATGGDFSPGSPVAQYDQTSGYLRQVLAWIGIRDVEIVMADRGRAGGQGETAVEQFGRDLKALAA